jgi:hypothetical protein
MPEVISRYRAGDSKTLPTLYRIPSKYGAAVLVNPDKYVTQSLPRQGGAHREGPTTNSFRAMSADTQIFPVYRDKEGNPRPAKMTQSIRDETGKPSWKRNWWDRNQHNAKPHLIAVGIGLVVMFLALILAECGSAHAATAPVPSTSAGVQLDPSNWGPGSAQGGPVPAPMPNRFEGFPGKLQICRILDSWRWGPNAPAIRTLELRFPEQRCALQNIPVGYDSEAYTPGE